MRTYNISGYALLLLHVLISALLAPAALGPWKGLLFGIVYMVVLWFITGVYLSDILHMGIAHRALDFKDWFSQAMALIQNTAVIYIDPTGWVKRHRKHHAHSDREGDPNKAPGESVWYLLSRPFRARAPIPEPRDPIFATWPFRLVSSWGFAAFSHCSSYAILWLLVRDWVYALALWISVRLFIMWGYLIINYWSHDRRFGERRYDEDDNDSVNIPSLLAIIGTFSGSWHNNHHHAPHLLRLTHDESEFDFGLLTVRLLKKLGLVDASATGAHIPADIPLREIGL